jgi:hypothetical protein
VYGDRRGGSRIPPKAPSSFRIEAAFNARWFFGAVRIGNHKRHSKHAPWTAWKSFAEFIAGLIYWLVKLGF